MERSIKYSNGLSANLQQNTATAADNIDSDKLYDDTWRSDESDAASLEEVPIDYLDIERNDCEHSVNNAITEVSNEFLSGKMGPSRQTKYGNSDESHSETEFKLVQGLAYVARYPESATGMSDNDWNPYGTESDTNVTPRVHSQNGTGTKLSGSRKSSLNSFNPPLHSTDLNVNTPSVAVHSIPDSDSSAKGTDGKSKSKPFFLLQPEISAESASISGSSQETKQSNSDDSHPETEFRLVRGLAYVARYPEPAAGMSGHEWNTLDTESDTSLMPRVQSQNGKGPKLSGSRKSSLTSLNPQLHSTNLNVNTPSAAVCSIPDYHSNTDSTNQKSESKSFFLLQPEISADFASASVRNKTTSLSKPSSESSVNHADLNKTFRGSNLSKSSKFTQKSSHRTMVDYKLLQKELQSIQDNLAVQNPEMRLDLSELDNTGSRQSGDQTCVSSGSDCDIIPSTTVTPDRQRNQMAWDYAADLGYQQPGGLMGDISLETYTSNSHRPSSDKKSFNSDGDETRTSDSSDKVNDHAAADQALAEMSQVLRPQAADHQTSYNSVDRMLCNLENQRQQIESGYQQLKNPGLAEKVSRILASQDPQTQASGILLEVTAQEKQMRSQLIVNPQRKDFNFSVAVSDFNESAESFAKPDNVRKRLDLSGLSSTEASRLVDSSSVYMPARKGFLVFDDVARLLSSQVVKASQRTFNNSLEAVVPHRTIQCYPLTVDSKIQQRAREEKPEEEVEEASNHPFESRPNWNAEDDRSEHTSSPAEIYAAKSEQSSNLTRSHDDSDSSSSRRREKYRPYRPAGSKEVYYTESDVASAADSATTMESTHFGSDDARGPVLPPNVLGTRQDAPNAPGIYGNKKPVLKQQGDILPPIQEKSGMQDERDSEASQSRKDNLAVESVRSHGKSPDESSSFAELERTSGPKKSDDSNQYENISKTNNRHSRSVAEGESTSQRSETVPVTLDGASNGRWASGRNQQERDISELQKRAKSRSEVRNSENNNSLSYNDFNRQYQRADNYNKRHTDMSGQSHDSDTLRQRGRTTQALLLRSHTPYDEFRDEVESQKYANPQVVHNRERNLYSTTDQSAYSRSRFHSENDERYFTKRYNEAEQEFSQQDPLSLPERRYREEIHRTLHRSHSDEDISACGRDKHLSRNSPHRLSSDLRKTTGTVSSHHAERSLRPSPHEWSDHQQTNVRRTQSPQPTFLARERGQAPRSYTPGLRPPAHPTRHVEEYSSAPRTVLTSRNMEGLRQPGQFMNPADRPAVASPESDHAECDRQPVSQRVQLLTQALSQEQDPGVQPDIDALWEQFKANNESSETSLNTSSLEAVTDLILHPSPHLVTQCLQEREERLIQRQERAEAERVQRRAERLETRVRQSSSEDDMNVEYAAVLSQKEEERLKRRAAKKKKGRSTNTVDAEVENCMDNLFSIAEDASFDQTPNKCNSALSTHSSNIPRRQHVIDPNMKKLRERISNQRQIIDKSTLKEIQKIEKLKKLEHLLSAKRRNEISDQTLKRQLEEISSASTPASDESQEAVSKLVESHNTTPLSDDSTTAKDSSTEMHSWKMEKEMRRKIIQAQETEQKNKYSSVRGSQFKNSLFARNIPYGEQREAASSESKLLKLVAEGILTAEEAYRIAVEREAAIEGKPSHEASHKSSMDDIYYRQNSRLHRLFSPYVRGDHHHHTHKNHYVPKVKSPQSAYDMDASYQEPWYDQDSRQNSSDVSDPADPGHLGQDFRTEFASVKTSQKAQSGTSSRAHSVPSIAAKSTRPECMMYHGKSPPRSATVLTFSPGRQQKITSPHRQQSPARCERRVSPSRSLASPRNKENNAKLRHNKKSTHRGSARHEKAHRSEQKSMQRQKSPMSGGIAWHIPLDVPREKCKLPNARRGIPLQERQLVSNTFSKKTKEQLLRSSDMEPLQGWQMTEEIGHKNRQKPDHSKGISDELWEHDALATKVNHRDVDPLMDRVEFILSKHSGNSSTEDENRTLNGKPLSKLSLQEALLTRKQSFISKCKERQKRLALAREHRKLQECLRLEREALFVDLQQMAAANINAHPYSDNLYQPKRRFFSKQEMKEITMKRYKKLPEVLQKQESVKKMEQCQLNRLRADIFNRKVQREILRKQSMRRR